MPQLSIRKQVAVSNTLQVYNIITNFNASANRSVNFLNRCMLCRHISDYRLHTHRMLKCSYFNLCAIYMHAYF